MSQAFIKYLPSPNRPLIIEVSLSDTEVSLFDTEVSLFDTEVTLFDIDVTLFDTEVTLFDTGVFFFQSLLCNKNTIITQYQLFN